MKVNIIHPYISKNPEIGDGVAIVTGTRIHVRNIISYYKLGYTPEDIISEIPHLSLAQIYDAFSYYHDHTTEIENEFKLNESDKAKTLLK